MKINKKIASSPLVLVFSVCLFVGWVAIQPVNGGEKHPGLLPPNTGEAPGFLLVDQSERAYTVFMAIKSGLETKMQDRIKGKKGVFLVKWSEFLKDKEKYLLSKIIKNEYQDSSFTNGIFQLLRRAPGVPFGVAWNGGVAVTYNDYQYVKKTFKKYTENPEEYERTRARDPRADPVDPRRHFGPLLGR